MKVIGLTGGIGSGKSTVARFLEELGAVIIDADKVGHDAFQPGTPAWEDIVATFGRGVLSQGGEIDRKKLGEIIFHDTESRLKLNRIMHSRMREIVQARIDELRRCGVQVVVLEAPLLIEAGWIPLVNEVWVTVAAESMVVERLAKRSGLSEDETLARVRSQIPVEERTAHADVVINTDGTLDEVRAKVNELWWRVPERPPKR